MGKHGELLSLIQELIEEQTNINIDDIADRAYQYYCDGDLSPTEYDHIKGLLDEL